MSHFNLTDRKMLAEYLGKIPYREIAKLVEKSISSISDEVKRNGGLNKYDPHQAEKRAQKIKLEKTKRTKLEISPGLRAYVIQKLKDDWSPEQISETLCQKARKTVLCHETIYKFIYSEEGRKLKLWQHLRHKKRPERVLHGTRKAQKNKSKIPQREHISLRSRAATERSESGHFEADLMIFSNTGIVLAVFVDRCTRKTWAYFNPNKTASAMLDTIREFVCDAGVANVKSISFDNGTENFYHNIVRDEFGTFRTYFCDPYCSWQKGTVENTNKLLRQYFPRKCSPNILINENLRNALHKLNNRPRKCLNFKTPNFCSV